MRRAPSPAGSTVARISTAAFDNDVQITFTTLEGKTYVVEHTHDIGKPNWQSSAQSILGSGVSVTVADPGGAVHPIRFYRVRIVE